MIGVASSRWRQTSSGLVVPAYIARQLECPTFVDLFCGCGGFSLGFLQAGWRGLVAVDSDQTALTTYWVNLCGPRSRWIGPHDGRDRCRARAEISASAGSGWIAHNQDVPPVEIVICTDVRELTGEYILEQVGLRPGQVDCVIGSPPCQGFSFAGHRNVHDPRNSLVFEFARLCHEMQPRTLVMENVPGITSMVTPSGLPLMEALQNAFANGGYCANWPKFEQAAGNLRAAGHEPIAGTRKIRTNDVGGEKGPQLALPFPDESNKGEGK